MSCSFSLITWFQTNKQTKTANLSSQVWHNRKHNGTVALKRCIATDYEVSCRARAPHICIVRIARGGIAQRSKPHSFCCAAGTVHYHIGGVSPPWCHEERRQWHWKGVASLDGKYTLSKRPLKTTHIRRKVGQIFDAYKWLSKRPTYTALSCGPSLYGLWLSGSFLCGLNLCGSSLCAAISLPEGRLKVTA